MKVYISCDLDGVCGVVDRDQLFDSSSADYRQACHLLTAEVNAAVAGALSSGATEVVVNDGHYRMRNLVPDELHPRARLIAGRFKPGFMVEGLDSSFGVCLFIGYHAAVGVADGTLNHTYHAFELRLNDLICSEGTINAAVAGHLGVPVGMVTGDTATIESLRAQVGGSLRGVAVKTGITRLAARHLMSVVEAREAIEQEASEAVLDAIEGRAPEPLKLESPVTMRLTFKETLYADASALLAGAERIDGRTLEWRFGDVLEAYRTFVVTYYLSRGAES
ncbi:MAG TPA: M55 family metallopeptidase [Chloroflexia bacterium]|nr:M55 family metallopeptidase [Chloroflexia bacterium]